MAKLGALLGAILSEASAARVQADLESVKIAKMYESDPFLKQMPIPRFRLPEISIDIPIAIENEEINDNVEESFILTDTEKKSLINNIKELEKVKLDAKEDSQLVEIFTNLEKETPFPMMYRHEISLKNKLTKEISKNNNLNKKLSENFNMALIKKAQEISMKKAPIQEVGITAKTSSLKELSDGTNLMNVNLVIREDSFDVKYELDNEGQMSSVYSPE